MPVINHFLEDVSKHGKFSGFCNLGIRWQAIESEHMRKYFNLATKETGVLVSKILRMSCCYNQLQRGDVLMSLDGVDIADDGSVRLAMVAYKNYQKAGQINSYLMKNYLSFVILKAQKQ